MPIDAEALLAKIRSLQVSEWSYKSEFGVRHIGPMAQDFYSLFQIGEDDRHISMVDEDGVVMGAIEALEVENELVARRQRMVWDRLAKVLAQRPTNTRVGD
jgi:hypothetical protein